MIRFVDTKRIDEAQLKKIEADFWKAEPSGRVYMQPNGVWIFVAAATQYSSILPEGTMVKEIDW